ncbi:hypothetical protein H5410_009150 [Solanum commersonii]|uniref:Uncharacterized protein n=1 Tax=Solanum commersonii TaxID=4109 RepID=A0A9J6AHX1_SOLCO|nr:hypothetical protein H5410_009150 [Solanum commersonii]
MQPRSQQTLSPRCVSGTSDAGPACLCLAPPEARFRLFRRICSPSLITIPRALLRGGMSRTQLQINSPNLFNEQDWAHRKDWLKDLRRIWHVGDKKAFRRARNSSPKATMQLKIKGDIGNFDKPPSGSMSSTQLAKRPNVPTFNLTSQIQPGSPRKQNQNMHLSN